MQSILRLTGFVLFGVGGIAAAVCFALWSEPPERNDVVATRPSIAEASLTPVTIAAVSGHERTPRLDDASVDVVSQAGAPSAQTASAAPRVSQQVSAAEEALETAKQGSPALDNLGQALDIIRALSNRDASSPNPEAVTPQANSRPESPLPPIESGVQRDGSELRVVSDSATDASMDADGRFQLNTKPDADLRQVLELLSKKSGLNIIASNNVQGTVSASLNNVDTMTALDAILKSTGYVAYREGDIIFVGTADEYRDRETRVQNIDTRIYRPNYVTATELQQLVAPLLTAEVGTISISSAAEMGIQSNGTEVGGDSFTGNEVVLVRDYENVLKHIDHVFREIDRQPHQVAIEAMILSVSLSDELDLGVDFELLKNQANLRLLSGSPPASLGAIVADGGLKVGFLDSSTTLFVEALETIGDTNVIATPRLLVLNKQRAEILIGSELGYVSTTVTETAVTQAVEFLEVGTQLRIRPFITSDGMIRMEVHPELSTGSVRVESGFTLPDKEVTEVTTNIMAQDGSTVVIGGLMREDLDSTVTQIPFLGSLPVVGPLFRQTTESSEKREIIVLITPRIICQPELDCEGDRSATEFHHRQAIVGENFSRLSRDAMSRRQLYMAQDAWAAGHGARAMNHVNRAIHFNSQNRAAIDLRADIYNGVPFGDHTGQGPYLQLQPSHPIDGREVAPWLLDQLETPPVDEVIPPGQAVSPIQVNPQ